MNRMNKNAVLGSTLQAVVRQQLLESLENTLTIKLPKLVRAALKESAKATVHAPRAAAKPATLPAVKRPQLGGKCAAVWDECDHMLAAGTTPTLELIRKVGAKKHWNPNNTRIEFYRWRAAQPRA